MAAEIVADGATIRVGTPQPLFTIRPRLGWGSAYDVSRDGLFLVNRIVDTAEDPVTLVVNWMTALKR
jgi:hypothetical protein